MIASPGYKGPDMHTTRNLASPTDGFLHKNASSFTHTHTHTHTKLQSYKHLSKSKLLSNPSRYPKRNYFWKVCRLCPSVLLVRAMCRWRSVQSIGEAWNKILLFQHFNHTFSTTFVIPASYQCCWLAHLWHTGNIWHPLMLRMPTPMHFYAIWPQQPKDRRYIMQE